MSIKPNLENQFEVHDHEALSQARAILAACTSAEQMQEAVLAAVKRNEEWRGQRCVNLLAPEAPTSPTVRALLASEVGTRAAEGHIGPVNRWFVGTQYIDEIEALCMELLKSSSTILYAYRQTSSEPLIPLFHPLQQTRSLRRSAVQ